MVDEEMIEIRDVSGLLKEFIIFELRNLLLIIKKPSAFEMLRIHNL